MWGAVVGAALLGAIPGGAAGRSRVRLAAAQAPPSPSSGADLARATHALLAERCFACHAGSQQKGGLRLDSREGLLRGGDSGPALRSGDSAGSLLVRMVSGKEPGKRMPPTGELLSPRQVALLRAWIDQGAPAPAAGGSGPAGGGGPHWAFQPVHRLPLPVVRTPQWVRNPVDAFVLARLEKERVRPSPEADRPTLLRRLTLDLLGLLPTPEETAAFVADPRPDAYERQVDRLLASPHFGERWGRHWLDLARYGDSDGYEKDSPRPFAYVYRDWVIEALNRDLPFDQFTIEQLAGDLLPNTTVAQKIATGFHRNTLKNREGGVDQEEDRNKIAVDRTSTTGTVWLGLTLGCAECHSHKYDPISQREFYQFFAFFNNTDDVDISLAGEADRAAYQQALKKHQADAARLAEVLQAYERTELPARLADWEAGGAATPGVKPEAINRILATSRAVRTAEQQAMLLGFYQILDPGWKERKKAITDHGRQAPTDPGARAQTLQASAPRETRIHVRGDFLRKGDAVQPGTPAVLPAFPAGSARPTRLDLARWLVDPANPLTPRVTVNRVWQALLGAGLVNTPNDFGTRGELPTHPELLDWLAAAFAGRTASGRPAPAALNWSLKGLIRLVATAATYRQSSRHRPELHERDPKNQWLARQNRFRAEAEVVRDLNLAASGLLHRKIGGASIRPPLPADIAALGYAGSVKWPETQGPERHRRGMYIFYQRTVPYPQLTTFDAPDANTSCTRRERSNTPLQALTLLNDPVFVEAAQALGRRIVLEASGTVTDRVRFAFRSCLNREPTARETVRLQRLHGELMDGFRRDPQAAAKLAGTAPPAGVTMEEQAAWVALGRTLLNLDEFITRE